MDINLEQFLQHQHLPLLFRSVMSLTADEHLQQMQTESEQYIAQREQQRMPHVENNDAEWKLTCNGKFSVKSAYHAMLDGPTITSNIHKI